MYDLRKVGERTWYVFCHDIFGFYQLNETDVCMIDSGYSDEAAEYVETVLAEKGWNLKFIINTHTHIDHLGGNRNLMKNWNCPAYATYIDCVFAEYEILEPSYMFGGHPSKLVQEAFLHPGKIGFRPIEELELPEGMEILDMPGHTFGMIGVKTPDDVWFLGDALMNSRALEKYPFGYLIDVEKYLETLEGLKTLEGDFFVLGHGKDAGCEITSLVEANIANIQRHIAFIKSTCKEGKNVDLIIRDVFFEYGIKCNEVQYTLIGSAVRCFLTYLQDKGELECYPDDGLIKWKTIN